MSDSHEITILFATFYGYALHVINSLAVVIFIPLACHQTGRVLLMIQLHLWNPREPLSVSGNLIAYISWRLMTSINDCMSIFLPRTINPESKNVCISGIGKGEHTPLINRHQFRTISTEILRYSLCIYHCKHRQSMTPCMKSHHNRHPMSL